MIFVHNIGLVRNRRAAALLCLRMAAAHRSLSGRLHSSFAASRPALRGSAREWLAAARNHAAKSGRLP